MVRVRAVARFQARVLARALGRGSSLRAGALRRSAPCRLTADRRPSSAASHVPGRCASAACTDANPTTAVAAMFRLRIAAMLHRLSRPCLVGGRGHGFHVTLLKGAATEREKRETERSALRRRRTALCATEACCAQRREAAHRRTEEREAARRRTEERGRREREAAHRRTEERGRGRLHADAQKRGGRLHTDAQKREAAQRL